MAGEPTVISIKPVLVYSTTSSHVEVWTQITVRR